MTTQQIKDLFKKYELTLRSHTVEARRENDIPGSLEHLRWMCIEAYSFIKKGKIEKAQRWLGFIQGVLWSKGIVHIDELKADNRKEINKQERMLGCLIGLAVGDAYGTTYEFNFKKDMPSAEELPDRIVGGGPFNMKPGEFTDDTSMALCLAESLVKNGWNEDDQMKSYINWWQNGYMSVKKYCFDIGGATRNALSNYNMTGSYINDYHAAGNGVLMRLAPIPMYFQGNTGEVLKKCAQQSRMTHPSPQSIQCSMFMGAIINKILSGERDKKKILLFDNLFTNQEKELYNQIVGDYNAGGDFMESMKKMEYTTRTHEQMSGDGYCISTLMSALWAFERTDNFKDGLKLVVSLGDDTDTTGAVYGQIAGAYYGLENIPWTEDIVWPEIISGLAFTLAERKRFDNIRWVIQDNLTAENDFVRITNLCRDMGIESEGITVIPFSKELPEIPMDNKINIYYGSTTLIDNLYKKYGKIPGVFFNHENFSMENYLSVWGELMLSHDARVTTFREFGLETHGDEELFFVRPDADDKSFNGDVRTAKEINALLENSMLVDNVMLTPDTKIIVSTPWNIEKEWRNYVIDGKVVTSSMYRKNFKLNKDGNDIPPDMIKFVEDRCKEYMPHKVFAMDIALCGGDYYIIECGCLNSVGLYHCDLTKLVEGLSNFVTSNHL